jgi:hypothetical protein
MTKAIVQTYSALHENITKISIAFLLASVFLGILYVGNLFAVISKTVALHDVDAQISSLSSSVDSLDSQYLTLSGKITPDNLASYGMSQVKVSEYISRSTGSNLGYAGNYYHVAISAHEF